MRLKSPKQKGTRLELDWRNLLRELDPYAQRTPLSGALAMIPSDIFTKLPFAFECKSYEKIVVYKWWDQAVRASTARKTPALVMRANNRPILVAMEARDWLQLLAYALKADYARQH